MTRRRLLQALVGLTATPLLRLGEAQAREEPDLAYGPSEPFSFDLVRRRAEELARQPYQADPPKAPNLLENIDYEAYQKIRFRSEASLWAEQAGRMDVAFFHLGKYTKRPVRIYMVADGKAHPIRYSPDLFDYGDTGYQEKLPDDLGFAGFRVLNPGKEEGDWLAFQGASYFRSSGELNQYGLSARGLAVNTAVSGKDEEFPRFVAFWLVRPQPGSQELTLYALLDGPSITGAYRFDCRNEGPVVIDIHAELFQRAAIEQLGLAPLTSMYWYSETNRLAATDWRPEIHDSDGLALWTGSGERIWRPLNNPPQPQVNTFVDQNPRGFGLLQRDRQFDHYQDDGVWYNRRPSVWVEPQKDWGNGAVYLVELPTNDEIHDNIVAYWVPDRKADTGTPWSLDYRLHWVAEEPYLPALARVVATYLGRPGIPGQHEPRDPQATKFVIDFTGGPLAQMEQRYDLEVVVEPSRGKVRNSYALKVVGTNRWRAFFDLHAPGERLIDIRCHLRLEGEALTETWLYQYFPASHEIREG